MYWLQHIKRRLEGLENSFNDHPGEHILITVEHGPHRKRELAFLTDKFQAGGYLFRVTTKFDEQKKEKKWYILVRLWDADEDEMKD